jgi:hypothetical protein
MVDSDEAREPEKVNRCECHRIPTFETALAKTNGILKQIEQAYNWPKVGRNQSYEPLRNDPRPGRRGAPPR